MADGGGSRANCRPGQSTLVPHQSQTLPRHQELHGVVVAYISTVRVGCLQCFVPRGDHSDGACPIHVAPEETRERFL